MVSYLQVHEWMSQINFFIFLCVLSALIILSVVLQRKKKLVWHGNTMLVIVSIAGLLTIAHMGPSLAWAFVEIFEVFNWVAFLGIVHGLIGLVTLVFGLWFVGAWAFANSSELYFCTPRRKLMRRILSLWIVSLALGLAYYPLHLIFG